MVVTGKRHAPAAAYLRERTSAADWTGGWLGLWTGLDTDSSGKMFYLYRESNPDISVIHSIIRHYTDWATPALSHISKVTNTTLLILLFVAIRVILLLWTAAQAGLFLSSRWMRIEIHSGMIFTGIIEELGEKPVPIPLCPPQIPHGLTWTRTRVSALRGGRLTAWAKARPNTFIISGYSEMQYSTFSTCLLSDSIIETLWTAQASGRNMCRSKYLTILAVCRTLERTWYEYITLDIYWTSERGQCAYNCVHVHQGH
jgi:hypothetical protein